MLAKHASSKPADWSLCVTTHGIMLSAMLTTILLMEMATPELTMKAVNTFKMENTGISIAKHEEGKWRIITINDFSHL
jgi:hypothetical protein